MKDSVRLLVQQITNDDWYLQVGEKKVCKCCDSEIREEYSFVFGVPLYFCTHTEDCPYMQSKRQPHE